MRILLPAAAALFILAPAAAQADPVAEARSATAACLSAVLNDAPVEDIDGDDVTIRRGKDPVSCTVTVTAGIAVQVREAVLTAIQKRSEAFSLARSSWAPGDFATRETWCNLPGRRAVGAFVSTGKPGHEPVLVATVFETPKRDQRCDRDLGVQAVADKDAPAPAIQASQVSEPTLLGVAPAKPKKKSLRDRIPGLRKKD